VSHKISVVLADDHAMVRKTLRDRLARENDLEIVADVGDADEAIAKVVEHQPDVLLLDIDMPGMLCFRAAEVIGVRCPATRIIFLSGFLSDRYIEQALAVRASGYLTKGESPESIIEAIRKVASGVSYYSPEVQSRIVLDSRGARLAEKPRTRSATLTPREGEVIRYIARGLSKKEIATTMHISLKTVEVHTNNLMKKLDIHDRVELARYAIREGLAEV